MFLLLLLSVSHLCGSSFRLAQHLRKRMPAHSPTREELLEALFDFCWRCGRRAKAWCRKHSVVVTCFDKCFFAFWQGWKEDPLDIERGSVEEFDTLDIFVCNTLSDIVEKACKRSRSE